MPPKKKIFKITDKKRPSSLATMENPWEHSQIKNMQKLMDKRLMKERSDYSSSSSSSSSISSDSEDEFNPSIKSAYNKNVKEGKTQTKDIRDINIEYIETNKDCIIQRPLMEAGIIPRGYSNLTIMSGSIGSGKTNCLINMLINPLMYGKDKTGKTFYDQLFIFSNSNDDAYETLIDKGVLKPEHIKHLPEPEDLKLVLDKQKLAIKQAGKDLSKIPITFLVFDDIIDAKKFITSKEFKLCAIRPRQLYLTVFILVQHFNAIPRIIRLQAQNLILFRGNNLESEIYYENYCPAGLNKKGFYDLLNKAWKPEENDKYPFLHINRRLPNNVRFRRNFNTILDTPD